MLLGLAAVEPAAVGQGVTRLVMQDDVIMRITIQPRPMRTVEWVEHKGPKCIHSSDIRGAFLSGNDQVDFVMDGRRLLRAELDETCPALDFYAGFYLTSDDGKICVKRDSIRSRMGGACGIDKFRRLEPKRRN